MAKGKVYRKCICGDIIIEDTPIDHSNHTGISHVISPAATCENDGYEYDKCTGCGAEMNGKMIPKLGHQWSIVGTTQGYGHNSSYVTQECSRCNKLQTISSSGTITSGGSVSGSGTVTTSGEHTAHNYVYKYDITEDDKVYQVWQCDVCGDTEKRLLEANGHHYEYKYTENDCTTGTYEIWQCTGCGEIERRMTAAASGHVWVEQSGGRDSTCNINGFRNYICSKCGLTKVEMLPLEETTVAGNCANNVNIQPIGKSAVYMIDKMNFY